MCARKGVDQPCTLLSNTSASSGWVYLGNSRCIKCTANSCRPQHRNCRKSPHTRLLSHTAFQKQVALVATEALAVPPSIPPSPFPLSSSSRSLPKFLLSPQVPVLSPSSCSLPKFRLSPVLLSFRQVMTFSSHMDHIPLLCSVKNSS